MNNLYKKKNKKQKTRNFMDSKPWSWNHDFSHLVCICKQENNQNIIDHT